MSPLKFAVQCSPLFLLCFAFPGYSTPTGLDNGGEDIPSQKRMQVIGYLAAPSENYYSYPVEKEDVEDVRPGARMKRYVDEAIPRLADNYHDKLYNYPSKDLTYPGGDRPSHKRMEMIGNLAVPASDETLPDHDTTLVTTVPPKKVSTKKPVDPLDKKMDDAFGAKKVQKTAKDWIPLQPDGEDDVFAHDALDDFFKEITETALEKHNVTSKQEDHHLYYNSTSIVDPKISQHYWVDMDKEKNVTVSEFLSRNHRRAMVVKLSFLFPFYGHIVSNITITTGGFLYTGDLIHSWLASTQYIAPLMANFDTNLTAESHIKFRDNGTAFTVEWTKVALQDKVSAGQFTFQVTIHSSGDIVFVYKDVPIPIDTIEDNEHPVKVGLSDAYIINSLDYFTRKKKIYEYHTISFKKKDIMNWTLIYMNALPTCLDFKDCHSCLTEKINFDCKWCPISSRCSTGMDRNRQDWDEKRCNDHYIDSADHCSAPPLFPRGPSRTTKSPMNSPHISTSDAKGGESSNLHSGHTTSMLGIIFTIIVLSGIAMWVLYAYRNPHTPSGQVLIKYRPSQWSMRRGEARYTPATIHM